jgi:hypothetical protein
MRCLSGEYVGVRPLKERHIRVTVEQVGLCSFNPQCIANSRSCGVPQLMPNKLWNPRVAACLLQDIGKNRSSDTE